jgi:hypothetical protein
MAQLTSESVKAVLDAIMQTEPMKFIVRLMQREAAGKPKYSHRHRGHHSRPERYSRRHSGHGHSSSHHSLHSGVGVRERYSREKAEKYSAACQQEAVKHFTRESEARRERAAIVRTYAEQHNVGWDQACAALGVNMG